MAYCEQQQFIIKIVENEESWIKTLSKEIGLSPKQSFQLLGVWTSIADIDWGDRWETPHIYINKPGLKRFGFPDGSESCKIIHAETDARLRLAGAPRLKAHLEATKAEFFKAKKLGILGPYVAAEIKSSLRSGLVKDAVLKTLVYLQIRKAE